MTESKPAPEGEAGDKPLLIAKPLLADSHRLPLRHKFVEQAGRSYLLLSSGMGFIALLLPVVLVWAGGYASHHSISHFYYAEPVGRNVLVGGLWAIGVFLFLFHGLSNLENWLLNLAGLAAVSVAMNPMNADQNASGFSLHYASALVLFACIGTVAIFLSKGRVQYIREARVKQAFTLAYNTFGTAMLALPAIVTLLHFIVGRRDDHSVYWVETAGIWSFSAYWLTKTYEYRLLLGIRYAADK